MTRPLHTVLEALEAGVCTRSELAARTGLDPELVDTAVDHLVRSGRLLAEPLGSGCPSEGCGECGSGTASGQAGCGAPSPATSRGPVALVLRTGTRP